MHMHSERTQVLLTPAQRGRLERIAAREGRSLGAVIRDAIDAYTLPRARPPGEAVRSLAGLRAAVDDWEVMKADIARGAAGSRAAAGSGRPTGAGGPKGSSGTKGAGSRTGAGGRTGPGA